MFTDVEWEFKEHEDKFLKQSPSKKSGSRFETVESMEEELFAKKCENLLLQSHIQILSEIYQDLDKYNDGIIKWSEYIMALRTDERVV